MVTKTLLTIILASFIGGTATDSLHELIDDKKQKSSQTPPCSDTKDNVEHPFYNNKKKEESHHEDTSTDTTSNKSLPFPKCLEGRNDLYNHQIEINNMMEKLKLTGGFIMKNKANQSVTVKFVGNNTNNQPTKFDVIIPHNKAIHAPKINQYLSASLEPLEGIFLDIYKKNDRTQFAIRSQQRILVPRALPPFQFVPQIKSITDNQIKQYNEHVNYLTNVVCKEEGINPTAFFQMRGNLYEKYKPEILLKQANLPITPRIPLNLFSVWLTSMDNPVEPHESLVELALTSRKNNPPKEGWRQFFVVQNRNLLSNTVKKLENAGIEILELQTIRGIFQLNKEIDEAIASKKYGRASDALRVELIHKFGGGYLDIDFQSTHSLKLLFSMYDSINCIEPMSEYVGNAFFAAKANHPIMNEYIRLIKRNFSSSEAPRYIQLSHGPFKTIVETGPSVLSVAIYNKAGQDNNRDIIAPSVMFFPAQSNNRPEFKIPEIGEKLPIEAMTVHHWKTTWVNTKYGSNG